MVVGADTVVVMDDEVIGKPQGRQHAAQMLATLSDRDHEVLSAVAISFVARSGERHTETRLSRSRVWFRATSAEERYAYCQSEEPLDKAGAYAIQGIAAMFVTRIEGSYSGVMGLPLFETLELLSLAGVSPLVAS